jgi:hypothetical protein
LYEGTSSTETVPGNKVSLKYVLREFTDRELVRTRPREIELPLACYRRIMTHTNRLRSLSDDDLLLRLRELTVQSRRVEAELVAHIGEVDERRLYAREACSSMVSYCTEVLHLSEAESYFRIAVARASRKHPVLLTMLGDGRLHLSGVATLAPLLTEEKSESVLARATHKSKRQIEELVAELAPKRRSGGHPKGSHSGTTADGRPTLSGKS